MWQGSHRNQYELLQTCQCTFLKHFSITNNIWLRKIFSVDGLLRYRNFKIWRPLKQTKSKNGCHFFISTFENLQLCFFVQKDFSTLKVQKMQFVFGWAYDKGHCIFNLQCSLLILSVLMDAIFWNFDISERTGWNFKFFCFLYYL